MFVVTLPLILIFTSSHVAYAKCEEDTCIDVSTNQESNEVVITVKKGKPGGTQTTKPSTTSAKTSSTPALRKPWIPWLPKPISTAKPKPRNTTDNQSRIRKPRVRTVSSSQISDQVRSLLPKSSIITQPLANILVQQPVNFMTNSPQSFTTVLIVLNVPITIHLTPTFKWEFGDGATKITKLAGAPYPLNLIENTYQSAGSKTVTLTTVWSGYWRAGSMSAPINGVVTQRVEKRIEVYPAKIAYQP